MRKLGISIYPEHSDLSDNLTYLKKAASFGFSKIFTCLLSIQGNKKQILDDFTKIIQEAKKLNFEIIVDIAPNIFQKLGITYDNLEFFHKLGVDGLRLDLGFTGLEEALMTFNNFNLKIELNASQPNNYLANILSYKPDKHMILGCHNFYPKKLTGLSRKIFEQTSTEYKKQGIRVAAFITSNYGQISPWQTNCGLPTLEEHRNLEISVQARDLWNSDLVDDVIIGNAFATDQEFNSLAKLRPGLLSLDVDYNKDITDIEKQIITKPLHFRRGDASEYLIRSTMPRIEFKNSIIPAKINHGTIKPGDIIIVNQQSQRYKGEIHIACKEFNNEGDYNVVGRLRNDNLMFLTKIKPWQKYTFNKNQL